MNYSDGKQDRAPQSSAQKTDLKFSGGAFFKVQISWAGRLAEDSVLESSMALAWRNMITRRRMIANTGALLTVPTFLDACKLHPRLSGPAGMDPEANARALGMMDPILVAMNAGITAPTPHNTQAWKFRLLSPLSMLL